MISVPIQTTRFGRSRDRRSAALRREPDNRIGTAERRLSGIASFALFRNVDASIVQAAIEDCEVLALLPGMPLLHPGSMNDNVFLLLSGELGAFVGDDLTAGPAVTITPGETVGELSAIDGQPVSALVMSMTTSRVLRLPQSVFFQRLSVIPELARNLLAILSARMRRSNLVMLESQRRRLELDYLRQELDIARQLQASMLPHQRPLFPDRDDIDIAALMEPASAVGGDLFDAFFLDHRQLFFCVGDVSGHGVPAALFMARVIGLMRVTAMGVREPGRLMQELNEQLCAGNDTNMFVTLFCAILEVDTGRLVYANGGHCAPLLVSHGTPSFLPLPKGALIGAIPGLAYAAREIVLGPDETLLCFTDGVTEAESPDGREFGSERLFEVVTLLTKVTLESLIEEIRGAVADFSAPHLLEDDCTLLALRRTTRTPGAR
nr:SpoIIE family protein phosphatase [Methyloversatilis sp. XJ19-49]